MAWKDIFPIYGPDMIVYVKTFTPNNLWIFVSGWTGRRDIFTLTIFIFILSGNLSRKIIFHRDGRGVMVTKLDSDGEERESRRTLMLTAMCCPVGLFLLSYLIKIYLNNPRSSK